MNRRTFFATLVGAALPQQAAPVKLEAFFVGGDTWDGVQTVMTFAGGKERLHTANWTHKDLSASGRINSTFVQGVIANYVRILSDVIRENTT